MPSIAEVSGTVGTSLAQVGAEIPVPSRGGRVNVSVYNDGAAALNAFEMDLRQPDGTFYTFLSGGDFVATNNANMRFCTGTPTTLASGGDSHFHADCSALAIMRFRASTASGTAALRIYISAGEE